jgi:photosystem II stability/assembly factor-like uncharacterized protein
MKKTLFVLLSLLLSPVSFGQWNDVTGNILIIPSYGFNIDAVDSLNCAVAIDWLYVTTNGGTSWSKKLVPYGVEDVSMVDPSRLFITMGTPIRVYSSTDGGSSWNISYNGDSTKSVFLNYVHMFSASLGIAMGDAPDDAKPALFIITTDGGLSWRSMNSGYLLGAFSGDIWRRLSFPSFSTGYFYDTHSYKLYKTTDTCKTWTALTSPINITAISFYTNEYGFIHGWNNFPNTLSRTTDGGLSWQTMNCPTIAGEKCYKIEFVPGNPSKIWMLTSGNLYFSNDSGMTWTKDPVSGQFSYGVDIVCPDSKHGWLQSEKIFRNSSADQITSVSDNEHIVPSEFNLSQNYPNPFNPATTINYSIPNAGQVKLIIYNAIGIKVADIVNEYKPAGNYSVKFNASNLASGIYFYRIESGHFSQIKKMILLK